MSSSEDKTHADSHKGMTRRSYLVVIGVLLIVIILMASYILMSTDVLDKEYPNEDTPLELQTWGLTWVMEWNEIIDDQIGYNYTSMELRMMYPVESGGVGWSTPLWNLTRVNYTQFSPPATPELAQEQFVATMTSWGSAEEMADIIGIFVTDDGNDGRFNSGDRLCIFRLVYENGSVIQSGFDEDTVYQIGWKYSYGGLVAKAAYEFAIDDEELHAWLYNRPSDIWDIGAP